MVWRTATGKLFIALIIVVAGSSGVAAQDCID
jgi:hypothetical protein